jgi:hypothetical protein
MSGRGLWSLVVVSVLALAVGRTQGSPYDRVAYWDASYTASWAGAAAVTVRDAFQQAGYRVIGAAELKTWMLGHIVDKAPSVVVFCIDVVPNTVTETETAACTLRQYLEAGGKVVWYSDIPLYYQGVSGAGNNNWGSGGSTNVLGFYAANGAWDVNQQVKITALGTRWGLKTPWTSARPCTPTVATNFDVLATDTNGNAAA